MKIKYQNNIVAFLDVLGFSNLVFSSNTKSIEEYFEYIQADFKNQSVKHDFKYLLISDSIVISCDNTELNFRSLVKILSRIQSKLLSKQILIRGGISYGDLYINKTKNIVVGPALINAYNLEKRAVYPRIIIDRKFINYFEEGTEYFINKFSNWLIPDTINSTSDGFLFINYFRFLVTYNTFFKNDRSSQILQLIKDNYYSNTHFIKYDWLLKSLIKELKFSIDLFSKNDTTSQGSRNKNKKAITLLQKLQEI